MKASDYIKSQWKRAYTSVSKEIFKNLDRIYISRIDVNVVIDNFFCKDKKIANKLKKMIREFSE